MWAGIAICLMAVLAPGDGFAQPRCVFLECGPGNAPNPEPAQAPRIGQTSPGAAAQMRHLPRQKRRGERCHSVGGYNYCVSSVLAPQFGNTYGPDRLVDEDLRTAWVEGRSDQGEGEYIAVDLGGTHRVSGIQVMNGYHKNVRLFAANSRVRSAVLRFSNGSSLEVRLKDEPGIQTIEFSAREANWIVFELRSVFAGTKYKDTAVTEFRVLTTN